MNDELVKLGKLCFETIVGLQPKIKINGADYKIEYRKLINHYGMCFYSIREIAISPKYSRKIMAETLVHEALHGYYFEKGDQRFRDEQFIEEQTQLVLKEIYGKQSIK
jgi:hypothetical protein